MLLWSKWTKISRRKSSRRSTHLGIYLNPLGPLLGLMFSSRSHSVQAWTCNSGVRTERMRRRRRSLNAKRFTRRSPSWIISGSCRRFMICVTLARERPSRAAIRARERAGLAASSFCQLKASSNGCFTFFLSVQRLTAGCDVCDTFSGNGKGATMNGSAPQRENGIATVTSKAQKVRD